MKFNSTMKKILLLTGILAMLTAAQIVFGQSDQGLITYDVKINMHRRLPADRQAMKDVIPEFNTVQDQLFFNATESLYKPVEEEEEPFEHDNGPVRIQMRRPATEVYFNYAESKRVLLQELMGKKYLIEDSIKVAPWKFGTETKLILDKPCKHAFYYDEERKQQVVAWYTDQLRMFMGPENFNSLPGTILQVDINDGERVITATKVEFRPLKKNEMKIPSGGQRITQQEFRKLSDAQMERMRANGGNVIIRN